MTRERKSVQSSGVQSGHGCPIEVSGIHGNSGELTPGIFRFWKVLGMVEISRHSDPPCLKFVFGVWGDWGSWRDWEMNGGYLIMNGLGLSRLLKSN